MSISPNPVRGFDSMIGLGRLKQQIARCVVSCQIRGVAFPHTLFTGLGGTGKTTMARCIASNLGCHFVETEAADLKTRDHVLDLLLKANTDAGNRSFILFIDECHRLLALQEALYYPMRDRFVNRGGNKIVLNSWTLIGATTRRDMLDEGSFVTSFQNVWDIGRYSLHDIAALVDREFGKLGLVCWPLERAEIAKRCLGIPRVAVNMVRKIRDQVLFAHPHDPRVSQTDIHEIFALEEIDDIGLTKAHIGYLQALLQSNRQPKGLSVLAALLGRNRAVVEDTVEPMLLSLGMISATPKGRVLTDLGFKHLVRQGIAA